MIAPVNFATLAQQCAPDVTATTLAAIVRTESGFNPYAIGVVRARLTRQPGNLAEAVATARNLDRGGWNYSVGLAQVNRANFARYGLSVDTAFEPCLNLKVGADILTRCFRQARIYTVPAQAALHASLSCYYSGDFTTGYRAGYVQRVVMNAADASVVPAIEPGVQPVEVVPLTGILLGAPKRAGQSGRHGADGARADSDPHGDDGSNVSKSNSSNDDSAVVF